MPPLSLSLSPSCSLSPSPRPCPRPHSLSLPTGLRRAELSGAEPTRAPRTMGAMEAPRTHPPCRMAPRPVLGPDGR